MIYEIASAILAAFIVPLMLIFSRSIQAGVTRKINAYMYFLAVPSLLWAVFSFGNLLRWWSLLAIPIYYLLVLKLVAGFFFHVGGGSDARLNVELRDGQFGYGFFMILFAALSIVPYGVMLVL